MSNSSICLLDRTLSGATTPGQSGRENDDNEVVICILQSSSFAEASSDSSLLQTGD